MKVKIINDKLSHYNEELKVEKLNFDMVIAQSENEKICLNPEDVRIIPENDYEKTILKCKDIIKIKLHRGMSLRFYATVLDCLEKTIGGKIESIDLLKDEFRPLRKGLWEKLMLMVVNEEFAFTITVTGKHFGNSFDVIISERRLEDFVDECKVEVEWLEKEIDDRKNLVDRYKKAVKDIIFNSGKPNMKLLTSKNNKKAINGDP